MDSEELFVRTLDDLATRVEASDEYEMLMAAALLRKLLLDGGNSLVDQVNRAHRVTIRYRINDVTNYEKVVLEDMPSYFSIEEGIDGEREAPPGLSNPIDATRDQFLARRVMVVSGQEITVHHLIDQLAHVEGAVHKGPATNARQEVLAFAARELFIKGLPAGVEQFRAIARVVVRALTPLREAIDVSRQ